MKIFLVGSGGQVGKCLKESLDQAKNFHTFSFDKNDLDITIHKSTNKKILEINPDIVVNTAAYTKVDDAEDNLKQAYTINCKAVKNIADICNFLDVPLIHISTDYVFDGKKNIPYNEEDITNPISVYGKSKLNGEKEIKASKCKHIILRTSWVYSEYGKNFLKTMIEISKKNSSVNVISDQLGCPTYARDIAECLIQVISKIKKNNCNWGTYHYCGNKTLSWYDFAKLIFELSNIKIDINSISTNSYNAKAKRPNYSALDCSKFKKYFGHNLSDIEKGISKSTENLFKKNT